LLLADFQEFYGLRLADVIDWPPSEVLALVEVLPMGSRFVAHVLGGDDWRAHWGWDRSLHVFVDYINAYVAAHTPQGKTPWEYPRPTAKDKTPAGSTPFRALIGRDL
jgi:hypothetical protein